MLLKVMLIPGDASEPKSVEKKMGERERETEERRVRKGVDPNSLPSEKYQWLVPKVVHLVCNLATRSCTRMAPSRLTGAVLKIANN